MTTLREYIGGDTSRVLDGIVLLVPITRRPAGMPAEAAIRSVWGMSDGQIGVWFGKPGEATGQRWAITGIDVETELMEWEVVGA